MSLASKRLYRSLLKAWLGVGVIFLPLTWWCAYTISWPSDAYIYDLIQFSQTSPPSPDILVVAIDERSLKGLGRWPWPRSMHARLLEQLTDAGVKSVLFNVIFAEPSRNPAEDDDLALAMRRHGHVFLPMMRLPGMAYDGPPDVLLPIEPLRGSSRGIGHINVEADLDGMVRSISLREGDDQHRWLQLAWRVYEDLMSRRHASSHEMPGRKYEGNGEQWVRDHRVRIPYRGQPGHYPTVSYVNVLNGEVPAELLRDRIILVGATAGGMGARHPISLVGTQGAMPGVEIQAHLLDGLLNNRVVVDLEAKTASWLAVLPLVVLMLVAWWLRSQYLPWLVAATLLTIAGATWLAVVWGWWWPPSTSVMAVLVTYVLINWCSQSAALSWFKNEIERLEKEPQILPGQLGSSPGWGGALQQRTLMLSQAVARLRDTRRFMAEALDSFPVAFFITTLEGDILLANQRARIILSRNELSHAGRLYELLAGMSSEMNGRDRLLSPSGDVMDALSDFHGSILKDVSQHFFRLEVAPLHTAIKEVRTGWLVGLIDMTHEKLAEEQRAHMLRFLSHDLKAPQSSVLALIDLQNTPGRSLPEHEFRTQVATLVEHGLTLTEEFMQLTKVEFGGLNFDVVLLADVVMEAKDQVWPLAQQRKIRLECYLDDDGCPVRGDHAYLVRAVFNLLDNAIKYSPIGSCVKISVWREEEGVICEVIDQGVGISAQDIPYIFESYRRTSSSNMVSGYGLGLALVKAVMDKHGGDVRCDSEPEHGSRFLLRFFAWNDGGDHEAG